MARDALVDFIENLHRPGKRQRRKVADTVRRQFGRNFTSQRSAAGPWASLAGSTVRDRIRHGYAGQRPILVRSGSYRSSFVNPSDSDHSEDYNPRADGWTLIVGSDDERMPWHERGTRRMPARPVMDLDRQAERDIESVLDWIVREMEPSR